MIRQLASFDTGLVFSKSGSLDVALAALAGGLDVVGVDGSFDMTCSLVVAGSLDGAGSPLDTEGSRMRDVKGEAAEDDSAKPPEVNVVERVANVDCSEPRDDEEAMEMGEDKEKATLGGTGIDMGIDAGTPSLSSSMLMMVASTGSDAMTTLRFFILGAGLSLSSLFRFPFDGRFPGRMHIYNI